MAPSRLLVRGLLLLMLSVGMLAAPLVLTVSHTGDVRAQQPAITASNALQPATGTATPANAAGKLVSYGQAPVRQAGTNVVISEFRSRGPSSNSHDQDEFVELFNPTDTAVTMDGWSLWRSDCSGGEFLISGAIPSSLTLAPDEHFLVGGKTYSGSVQPDSPGIDIGLLDNGGLALRRGPAISDSIVDQVGMCIAPSYVEDTPLEPLSGNADQSYDRQGDAGGACQDTDNNAADFFLRSPSDPQNSHSPITTCGNPTPTPYLSATPTPTATRTPLGTGPRLIISEVGWAGTVYSEDDQWIELYNPSSTDSQHLAGWTLETTTGSLTVDLVGTLGPKQTFLLVHGPSALATASPTPPTGTPTACLVFNHDDVSIDQVFTGTLSRTGQIIYLINPSNGIEDSADRTNAPWPAGDDDPPTSMERSSATIADTSPGAWFTYAGDITSTPRDCGGKRVRGSPGSTNWAFSVTRTPSPTATPGRKPTPIPPTPYAHVVINEFLPRAGSDWNQDGKIDVFDEFIELKNLGPIDVDLKGWKIDNGTGTGAVSYTLPTQKLLPGERAVYYHSTTNISLPDSGGLVRLLNTRGTVFDARGYGPVEDPDVSHCRIPDGYYWKTDCFPTPGLENSETGTAPAPPPRVLSAPPPCLLADSVPAPFRQAECGGYGADAYDRSYWDRLAGQSRFRVPDFYSKAATIIQ